ncbi:Tol-Pal system beta propeller repeat protein TolB [Trichlorobacter lovleyi]|uniref:Tol-Pal system beta propeller repeat protein TolB n=1 Tax=Trichlorobacter lovleyi TaxID=313985 RepID=UPI0022400738|nr:Tol-Pal system beta propeller repeat protein TolB [Trichlorobacter lovleyi]QOX80429.1 Tol-Pal system beta propeller repeat protein TolB [Trichlorobacter lovleyi]
MKQLVHLVLACLLLLSMQQDTAAANYIEVTAAGNRLLKLAVVPPQPMGTVIRPELANETAEVHSFDLTMSGLVAAERRDAALLEHGLALTPMDFIPWLSAGYDLLIRGEYELRGQELTLEFRLYDVVAKKLLTSKRFLGREKDLRRYAHSFSDEVLRVLTGEKGAFTSKIIYVSTQSGNKELAMMDWDGFNGQQLTGNRSINLSPDISPDGREVIFTSYKRGNPDLYKRALSSNLEVPVSSRSGLNITGAWSPDGSKIALALSKDGNTEIYTVAKDGSSPNRLTVSHAANVSPAWTPDGSKIAFVSDRLGKPQIFVMDANGGNVRRLITNGSYNVNPSWSPKGDKLAFARMAGGFQIFVANADGSNETQLTFEGNNERPRWSPDGRLIAFSSRRGGQEAIYVMRADGSGQTKVSRSKGLSQHPIWSPRGQ